MVKTVSDGPYTTKTGANARKRADIKNEGFEVALPTTGASAAPICVRGRLCALGGFPAAPRSLHTLFPIGQGSISVLPGPLPPTPALLPPVKVAPHGGLPRIAHERAQTRCNGSAAARAAACWSCSAVTAVLRAQGRTQTRAPAQHPFACGTD